MARVVLAMSGGVDSSVAALLLKEAGHEVIGLFMRHGQSSDTECAAPADGGESILPQLPVISELAHKQGCCTAADAHDARRVADCLEIPFYSLNFEEEFGRIINYFVDEYTLGRTPNPCVVCNNWLKFGRLVEYADSVDAEYIATGHYAQLHYGGASDNAASGGATPALCRGRDADKDQSYVLFGIDRNVLPRLMFPVGAFHKSEIRARASEVGLRVAEKKDSQEICFVTQGHYGEFVRTHRGEIDLSGEIVTTAGEVVGTHPGIENFTIGQRKGLGVAFGEPRYVVRLEHESRRVVIGELHELERTTFDAVDTNWLIPTPRHPFECEVKIRYLSRPAPAVVIPLKEDRIHIELSEPRGAIAPGQAAVCYRGAQVLGGGWIS
ncbi:MAG: tRNA 2-thiouridine(34) synthase MnmA [Pirellulales bacterium]|nr:tRNA 2-thiouridine(34) synthase MnmA [Pirellulales bacterium]